jgi:hypothetical protein
MRLFSALIFFAAASDPTSGDPGAAATDVAAEVAAAEGEGDPAPAAPAAYDGAKLRQLLALDPAADDAAVEAKINDLLGQVATIGDLQTQLTGAQNEAANARQQLQDFAAKQRDAELDQALDDYDVSDEARGALKELGAGNRDAFDKVVKGLPKKGAKEAAATAAAGAATPPAPVHNPATAADAANPAPTDAQIAAATRALTQQMLSKNPKADRQTVWAQAEKQVRDKVQAGQPIS